MIPNDFGDIQKVRSLKIPEFWRAKLQTCTHPRNPLPLFVFVRFSMIPLP